MLRLTHLFDDSDEDAFAGPALDMVIERSAEETDLDVLPEVLVALGEHIDPRAEAALLPHAGHPDARVRRVVAQGFRRWSSPPALSGDARAALLLLITDPDAVVRKAACRVVAEGRDRDPVLADAMAAVLDDADRLVRLAAVYGLALLSTTNGAWKPHASSARRSAVPRKRSATSTKCGATRGAATAPDVPAGVQAAASPSLASPRLPALWASPSSTTTPIPLAS